MVHLRAVADDRRARARDEKRQRMLAAAGRVIDRDGLDGVTMQAVADELDAAVGTLYNYFPSKAALVAALRGQAVDTLRASLQTASHRWDEDLGGEDLDPITDVLVRLCAFGAFFGAASVVYADEFQLQRLLLSEKVSLSSRGEVLAALEIVDRLLAAPAELLDRAVALEALEPADDRERALVWVAAMNGVLLLDQLSTVDRHLFRAQHLARSLTHDLLTGWGGDRADVEVAASHVERLAALGPMAPPIEGPVIR
ncbi:MAG: helix-turn-helix domain-containing protein [Acidimicrobiales bacterium]